jgi:SPP1 family phage portal protein
MDEYDAVLSDSIGEIKDLRRALLKIKGDVFTEQDSEGNPIPIPQSVANSSVIVFGPDMDGKSSGDAEYITNNLNDAAITSTLNRLRGLIYETSGSVDLNLLSSGNAKTITEIKTTLLRLDNDAKTSESFLKMGLQKVLELWASVATITDRVNIDTAQFEIRVERRIPVDDAQRAELFLKLSSILSIADSLRLAGYEDVEALAERATEVVLPDLGV